MGNLPPIAYGSYALAAACKAACLSVPEGYYLYSLLGNYLGPAATDRPLRATTRTISQTQDDGKERICLFATADFMAKEASMFEYSRPPSKSSTHHAALPCTAAAARTLLAAGKVNKPMFDTFTRSSAVNAALFNVRPCPEGVLAQNLSGLATALPHALPQTSRTTADWLRRWAMRRSSAACSGLDFAVSVFGEVDGEKWCLRVIGGRAVACMSQQSIMRVLPSKEKGKLEEVVRI
ncbi:hypothetical protein EJ07DRAFT_163040 [Lizonia empirigonia]|nr:hypothetical protein EJ07DRAFT_163040 [Lizonia empirigonia]